MKYCVEDYVEDCCKAQDKESLIKIFIRMIHAHGFDRMAICFDTDHSHIDYQKGLILSENLPTGHMDFYFEHKIDLIDPVRIYSQQAANYFKWDDLFQKMKLNKKQSDYLIQLKHSDFHDGVYFPVGRFPHRAGIGLSRSTKEENFHTNYDVLRIICQFFYESLLRIPNISDPAPSIIHLTLREKEILELAAKGMTDQEIARELMISTNTVETHIKHIYPKLDVHNKTSAVAKALHKNLIKYT